MGAAFDRVTEALRTNGWKTRGVGRDRLQAQCPAHGSSGSDLNLHVATGDQGVLVRCHSHECSASDIASALSLTLEDLFDNRREAVYDYGGGHRVHRRNSPRGKRISQENKPEVTSLYRHPDSAPFDYGGYVVLVEGEKCVDAALRLGEQCVTTWPGGAGGVDQVDLSPLGGKHVRIIADNDEPGLKAASRLITRLSGIATVAGVWTAPNPKESVDDIWLAGGELSSLIDAHPLLPAGETEPAPPEPVPGRRLVLKSLADVTSRRTRFLWDKMIPQSAVSLAAGRGGTGKSSFMLWLAARINRGELPGELHGQPCNVLYVSHEDSLEEVLTPRADANGVDRTRFHSLGIESKELGNGTTVPRIPEDLPLIREAIELTGARLLVIDPITSTLQGADNDKMADVRQVMDPLNALAAELSVAIIGIAHFRKGGGNQSDLISGSHAWRDAARAVMLFARDEDNDATVMTLEKINSGEAGKSFQYRLDIVQQLTDEGTLTDVGRVVWEGESSVSVGDVVNQEQGRAKQGELSNDLLDFIRSFEGRAVSMQDLSKHFAVGGVKEVTVRKTVTRLVARGLVEKPAYGQYQAVIPPAPGRQPAPGYSAPQERAEWS